MVHKESSQGMGGKLMYLKHKNASMVEVLKVADLCDPCRSTVSGRFHAGEELQEPAEFAKKDLLFPSGEALPRCWLDPEYKLTD